MGDDVKKNDISADDGKSIVAEAATWKGTPYLLNGAGAIKGVGGDCSGTTQKIYENAKFPYEYRSVATFSEYVKGGGPFRELSASEQKQEGDILYWSNHMAIYSSFASDPANATTVRNNKNGKGTWIQNNDMWTAWHEGGPAFGTAKIEYWKPEPPRVFRYQK